VAELRQRLAEMKARFDAGRWKEALKDQATLVSQARAVGYQPLLAETLALVGLTGVRTHNSNAIEKTLVEAYRLADASRHDEVRAQVATTLVFSAGYQEGHFADALRWYESGTAVLQRLGGHELQQAWLYNNVGCAYETHHDNDLAVTYLRRGAELKQKVLGPDNADVAISEGNLGNVLQGMGRNEEALPHTDRAIAIFEKRLGSEHPDLAFQFANRAEILNALGRYEEGRRSFERARAIFDHEPESNAASLASALTGIGLSYIGEAKPEDAIAPLERALALHSDHQGDSSDRARTLFALARALWESNRDRGRARRLAEEAKSAYAKAAVDAQVTVVDGWLRSHGSG
jgi:tetratricopeptide (TPR) repeat protein